MTVHIRPARPADLPDIKLLLREAAEHLNAIDEPEPVLDEEIDRIEQLAFGSGAVCTVLIAERDGKIAGHLSYFWGLSTEGVAPALFVGDLYVRSSCRGQGIGRMLMQHAREIARSRNANQLI
jgi:diamine N-acetyltransferase